MALSDRVLDTTQQPIFEVRINGVLIVANSPTLSSGVPGIMSIRGNCNYDSPVPTVDIEVNRIPTWIKRGMSVTIDAGYASNGGLTRDLARIFTGGVLMRGDEDPEFLRTRCVVNGATDATGAQITQTASLIGGPAIWPPIPSGQYIDFSLDNSLIWDSTKAASAASRELTRRARIPQRPSGEITRRIIRCVGDLYGAFRSYQIPANDFSGQTVQAAMKTVLGNSGVGSYDVSAVPAYTLASSGATVDRAPGSQQLSRLMQIDGCVVQQLKSGVVQVKVTDFLPAPSSNFTYSTTQQAYARIVDTTSEVRVPLNPLLEIGQTLTVEIDYLDVTGRWFLYGHRWEISDQGAWSYLDLRGGGDYGGTVGINPVASFTWKVEREVIGDRVYAIVTFDASASYDPDGTISSYAWSDNQTTSPEIATITTKFATVRADPSVVTTEWDVTLTVTDNSGLTGSITQAIPIGATSSAVQIPAMFVAMNNEESASPDGGQTWNDLAPSASTVISVGARPADGVNFGQACFGRADGVIVRTLDACVTHATVASGLGSAVNDVQWDWRDPTRVWALTDSGRVYLSTDGGATFSLYDDLRTVTYISGAATSGALGNKLGLPAGDGVYVFGGDGAGTPLIAYDAVVGAHQWVHQTFTGNLATDTPADATMRIVDVTAPGDGHTTIILSWASGGGGSLVAIYDSTSAPGTSAAYTRATGLTAGLKNGRVIMADAPIAGTLRYALFGDQDVWKSTDCIAYTKTASVLPAGVTANHGLFLSDVLTGLPGYQGVFVLACENAGATLGVYKSVDSLTTVSALRPATGFPAWPASSKAKKISIGAPVKTTVAPGTGNLVATVLGASPNRSTKLTGTAWSALVNMTGVTDTNPRPFCLTSTNWFVTNGTGTPAYTKDGGATWAALSASLNGAVRFARDAGGRIWCLTNDSGGGTTALYYSNDNGDNWTNSWSFSAFSRLFSLLAAHPTNQNIIVVEGVNGSVNPVTRVSTDRGATWTEYTGGTRFSPQLGTSPEWREMRFLSSGRLIASGANGGGSPAQWRIMISDDNGQTWTTVYSSDTSNTINYYGLGATTNGKIVVLRQDTTSGALYVTTFLVSTDFGSSFSLVTPSTTLQTFTGAVNANPSAMAYDPTNDIAYVNDAPNASHAIQAFSPVSSGGAWTEDKYNIGSTSFGAANLSVAPA